MPSAMLRRGPGLRRWRAPTSSRPSSRRRRDRPAGPLERAAGRDRRRRRLRSGDHGDRHRHAGDEPDDRAVGLSPSGTASRSATARSATASARPRRARARPALRSSAACSGTPSARPTAAATECSSTRTPRSPASAEIANVTAVSFGDGGTAAALLVRASGGADLDVEATNVIAHAYGAAPDIAAGELIDGSDAAVALASSNFETTAIVGAATVTAAGTNGNQIADPVFTDPAGGDFSGGRRLADDRRRDRLGALARAARPAQGSRGSAARLPTSAPTSTSPRPTHGPRTSGSSVPRRGRSRPGSDSSSVSFETGGRRAGRDLPVPDRPTARGDLQLSRRLSPRATRGVGTTYTLTVRAVDAAGNRSGKAIRQVQLIRKRR